MNINKALEHIEWKFKNHWKPTPTDIKAFNSILKYKELQETKTLSENELLAKLWIHQLILFCRTGQYGAERSIQVLDEILNKSVYDWCKALESEIPMLRFGSVGHEKYPLQPEDYFDIDKLIERNEKIVNEFETELTKEFLHKPKEEDIIKFIKSQINRIVNKYSK